jgi:hypothetical protein
LPGLAMFEYLDKGRRIRSLVTLKNAIFFGLPVVGYLLYLHLLQTPDMDGRFAHLRTNFENTRSTIASLASLVIGFGVVGLLAVFKGDLLPQPQEKRERAILGAFFLTFLLNTLVVFFCALVRETRVFALPLVLLWPIAGLWIRRLGERLNPRAWWQALTPLGRLLVLATFVLSFALYSPLWSCSKHVFKGYFAGVMSLGMLWALSRKALRERLEKS